MTAAQVFIVLAALLAANLPFLSDRRFLVMPANSAPKGLGFRLLELLLLYGMLGAIAHFLEARAHGNTYPQGWEFYAITLCLFIVMAFPGFATRYLWRQR